MQPVFNVSEGVGPDADPILVWEAIVSRAIEARVSDIHVLSLRSGAELAFRLDGEMLRQGVLAEDFARRMISHVKTMADIDLGESRRPTEGRMRIDMGERSVDLRVSAVPTIHGQDLVVRIFDRTISLLDLGELGLLDDQLEILEDMIQRPHGLILVSGPTGSGKTTTLYAMLRRLTGAGRKILTIENPVEYDLDGVNQTQVNPKIGVNFSMMLTAILRQDPDIIMVGEIRDEETAVTAVRAATTGHLVLATTHAIRASRAVETLLSLGVHPYFLAIALRGVIAQVLVKTICPKCKQALPETADMVIDDVLRPRLLRPTVGLYQGTGCDRCFGSGYAGRQGIFEVFTPDDAIKQLILSRCPATDIEEVMRSRGLLTLDQAGKLAALNGQTTMEEVIDILPLL
ncbi:MAG: type II/IV secretion system protein [Planctomycetes bacterium]|nr:type II/IV secretion system protein [Planctomycetota bacterium]